MTQRAIRKEIHLPSPAKFCDTPQPMSDPDPKELRRRTALTQMALALLDPQKLVKKGGDSPAYEADATEIARASFRFSGRDELGLAIHKILEKRHGRLYRRFDTFALAGRLIEQFGQTPGT